MSRSWRTLRVQLAVVGFLAIYLPVLLLFGVTTVTEDVDETVEAVEVTDASSRRSPWVTWTVVGLAPAAAGLAWWWAGRAVRPFDRVRVVAEDIEAGDLSRRIDLDRGPTEAVALASAFDAMLDRLEQAAEAQRRLVEEASHELRTPLSVLMTNAEVLLAHPDPDLAVYRQGLERSRDAALRLRATVDELLVDARGRARTLDRRPADLLALVVGVVDDARAPAEAKHVALRLSGPPALACALDEVTVRRAVANLVDNAIRHAPAGSSVEVDVAAADTEARVAVTDHGPGIPADDQHQVFDRFWRGRTDGGGTGLGLPIANQVALAHGGDLTVRSPGPAGDGSQFVLRLARGGAGRVGEGPAQSRFATSAGRGGPMRVTGINANLPVADIAAARDFYTDYLGLNVEEFNLGWVARYSSPGGEASVQLVTRDATAPQDSVISVHAGSGVDEAYEEATRRGYEIVHPLTDEAWGVRRFLVRAPDGNVINVVSHSDE